ncbi:ATP-grasp domain-containing protein [Streptomyces sennicomposti]|uniref:ATP-grasp domain-containing protein n=1 Tax=Streptomyces sennicomposti TaxID=2873384 RepID=UPI001CA64E87|nr:alpha-L-glutamate ligase [Streptomyces sennicomposti]MBY8867425.1 alpha-L-glutamate ligase [Streptomyces sennicomposti]
MRIGLITSDPAHPLLAATTALLAAEHTVQTLDPATAEPPEPPEGPADVYLLKARTPRAISLARALERRGARVLNSAAATELCQDRTAMAEQARRAGLPFAATRTYPTLAECAECADAQGRDGRSGLPGPVVVKSRHSRKHDLVTRVDSAAQLRELAAAHPEEPVVVQEFAPNSGWDHKLWAIGDRVFTALRRSELSPGGRGPTRPLAPDSLPPGWTALVHRVGEVFALDVYGVDVIDRGDGVPLIVDVNAFPGVRDQPGAPQALAALTLSSAGAGAGAGA